MEIKNIKNKVEIKDDVALISVNRAGAEQFVIVDSIDLPRIDKVVKNRLNIDTTGYVQHRQMVNGVWEVFQLHRFLAFADDSELVGFRNGNKLDLRFRNLIWTQK
jgi:hypothetical protein